MVHAPLPTLSGGGSERARIELARISLHTAGSLRVALREVAVCAAEFLRVSRVSLWAFVDDGRLIRCECLYQNGTCTTLESPVLAVEDFPRYFAALGGRRVVPLPTDDASGILDEFRECYMTPLGINAMLDAAVYRGGRMHGVVCHEHTGPARGWSEDDSACAAAVADAIARLYEEHQRAEAEQLALRHHEVSQRLQHLSELGRLAAGIAHDINNVLTAVMGNAELLALSRDADERDARTLRGLLDATQRGVTLTRQLSQLAREEHRAPHVLDLATLLDRDAELLRSTAGPDVQLELDIARDTGRVLIDGNDLGRALLNLVANARDASTPGSSITVRLREVPHDVPGEPPLVALEVTDRGQGMSDEARRRAFEPFYTTKGDAGTGLGLSIVRQIVGLAGGSVELESRPGRGTTVRLVLPTIATAPV